MPSYWSDFPPDLMLQCALTPARTQAPPSAEETGEHAVPHYTWLLIVSTLVLGALWSGLGTERSGRPVTVQQEISYEPQRPF